MRVTSEASTSADRRAQLGRQQTELLHALVGKGPPPEGFDTTRLEATAESLTRKRRQAVARVWPLLAGALGERFAACFAAFTVKTPLPALGGPLADGRAFARTLAETGELPESAQLEVLGVDLFHKSCAQGLVPRRGLAFKTTFLREARRLVLAVRLPWLNESKSLSIPLPW